MKAIRILILSTILIIPGFLWSQNLENIKDQQPIKFSGNVNVGLNTYATTRERPSRDPFIWTLSGSPTLSIYGVTLPFSFVFSKKNESFRQPFNQFGVSPYYKWLKLHLGYRSLAFSDYSLNGHVFSGVGLEANPGKFRFGTMYGRLLKPIEQDTLADYPIQPTYLRKGFTVKVGAGSSSNYLDIILFKGWDEPGSIDRPVDSAAVNPQQNLVIGIKTQQRLFTRLLFNMDVGLSGWTSNLFADGPARDDYPLSGVISNLLKVNYSTQFLKAGKVSLAWRIKQLNLKMQYQRIDPDYETMGAYFFNNDLENITFSPGWAMFKRKVRINASVGWQRNNIFDNKTNQTNRRINSLQLNYSPSAKLNFSGSYTNFQITQRQISRVERDVIDSLQLEQFSNNLSFNLNYNFGDKINRYGLGAGFYRQSMNQALSNEALRNNDSRSLSPNLSFRFNNTDTKWGYRASLNYNDFQNSTINTIRWGFSLGADKRTADDKLSANATVAYNKTKLDGTDGGNTIRIGLRGNYKPAEKHTISIGTNFVKQKSSNERIRGFSEFLGNLNYSYSF